MKALTQLHLEEILKEMCNRVGADKATLDTSKPDWYWEYSWTEVQQEDFRKWLAEFLIANKYFKKTMKYKGVNAAYYYSGKFIADYGWKSI